MLARGGLEGSQNISCLLPCFPARSEHCSLLGDGTVTEWICGCYLLYSPVLFWFWQTCWLALSLHSFSLQGTYQCDCVVRLRVFSNTQLCATRFCCCSFLFADVILKELCIYFRVYFVMCWELAVYIFYLYSLSLVAIFVSLSYFVLFFNGICMQEGAPFWQCPLLCCTPLPSSLHLPLLFPIFWTNCPLQGALFICISCTVLLRNVVAWWCASCASSATSRFSLKMGISTFVRQAMRAIWWLNCCRSWPQEPL